MVFGFFNDSSSKTNDNNEKSIIRDKYVVIGGAGNVGSQIIETLLLKKKDPVEPNQIVCVDLMQYTGSRHEEMESVVLDIANPDATSKLQQIIKPNNNNFHKTIVFHTASIIDIRPIPSPRLREVNVQGTRNIVQACQRVAAEQASSVVLIYTSSLECVSGNLANGQIQRLDGVNEDVPYPATYFLPYAETKSEAERIVLAANDPSQNLVTISIRPGYIVGPDCIGVKLEIIRAFERSARNPVYVTAKVPAKISCVNTTNCAVAHLLAAEKATKVAGQAFFVADFDANVVDLAVHAMQDSPIRVVLLPLWLALSLAWLMDRLERLLHFLYNLFGFTRVSSHNTVDVQALKLGWHDVIVSNQRAVEQLGYGNTSSYPALVGREECLAQLKQWAHEFIQTTMIQEKSAPIQSKQD